MADLETQFQRAADEIKKLKARPTDQELLELYGLFKQASAGDCNQARPGMFQLKEKAKYEFWLKNKGMSQDDAKSAYIKKAESIIKCYGLAE